ncbi:F-box/kelch-repeat protein At3g06240-like [Bidens hawaiensis]|uniref:F-box/kelch-repeat protein At3g06240-like n=1 Tax=Bidens hawaiensis TaxID=980011 RepID=UPI004049A545
MNRLPLESLIQCRSVSKTWKSLIDSSNFIKMHFSSHRTQVQHILVIYEDLFEIDYRGDECEEKYVLVADDHTFPEHKVSPTLPRMVEMLKRPRIIGSSHGLLGLYGGIYRYGRRTDVAVLWNISIRKAIAVALPNVGEGIYGTAIGFGVCRETNDPKIVKITFLDHHKTKGMENVTCNPPEVEVFTLGTWAWRRSYGNLPRKSIQFDDYDKVNIDGIFYWLAKDVITVDGGFRHMIISFDMTSEEFKEVTLPDSFANMGCKLYSYKRGESLIVVVEDEHPVNGDFDVWMMVDGVPKSFTKLCTVTPNGHALLAEFRKTGEPIYDTLVINDLVIDRSVGLYYAYEYMETLLLANQPNFMVYE